MSSEFDDIRHLSVIIKNHPPLNRETELDLATKARAGDKRSRELMVAHNIAMVISQARKFIGRGVRLEDLVQEGSIGLVKAVEQFDPGKGWRFSTYAVWWIRAYLMRGVRDSSAVRRTVEAGGKLVNFDVSLDEAATRDGDGDGGGDGETTHLDLLEDERPLLDEQLSREEQSRQINEALQKVRKEMGERKWAIVRDRFSTDTPLTLDEIGKQFNLSRERIRQLENQARKFLAGYLAEFADRAA